MSTRRQFIAQLFVAGGFATPEGRAIVKATGRALPELCAEQGLAGYAWPEGVIYLPEELLADAAFDVEGFLAHHIACDLLDDFDARMAREDEPPFGSQLAAAFRRAGLKRGF